MASRLNTAAPVEESTSLKFGWVGNVLFILPPLARVHRMIRAGESRTFGSTYRARSGWGSLEKSGAVAWRFPLACFRRFPPVVLLPLHTHIASLPRVHVGIPFSSVTWPTAPHYSEARVLFRVPDWLRAAEARPKSGALIGRRPINSDCHVLMEGSAHKVALWWWSHGGGQNKGYTR